MSKHSSKGAGWEKIRKSILERDNYICQLCLEQEATEVDHIYPKSAGGSDDEDNLQASCSECNRKKLASIVTRNTWFDPDW